MESKEFGISIGTVLSPYMAHGEDSDGSTWQSEQGVGMFGFGKYF